MDIEIRRLADATDRIRAAAGGRVATGRTHQDADDEIGTIGTDDARDFDPLRLLRVLDAHGGPVVVIGQVAGIMHGSRDLTGDLDLLWDGDPRWAAAMAAGFGAAGSSLADDDGVPVPCEPAAFGLPKVLFSAPGARPPRRSM